MVASVAKRGRPAATGRSPPCPRPLSRRAPASHRLLLFCANLPQRYHLFTKRAHGTEIVGFDTCVNPCTGGINAPVLAESVRDRNRRCPGHGRRGGGHRGGRDGGTRGGPRDLDP